MWTGIIVIIAFYAGFLVASMLACAKDADKRMVTILKPHCTHTIFRKKLDGATKGRRNIQQIERREFARR